MGRPCCASEPTRANSTQSPLSPVSVERERCAGGHCVASGRAVRGGFCTVSGAGDSGDNGELTTGAMQVYNNVMREHMSGPRPLESVEELAAPGLRVMRTLDGRIFVYGRDARIELTAEGARALALALIEFARAEDLVQAVVA